MYQTVSFVPAEYFLWKSLQRHRLQTGLRHSAPYDLHVSASGALPQTPRGHRGALLLKTPWGIPVPRPPGFASPLALVW